jgi:hypothetical protein
VLKKDGTPPNLSPAAARGPSGPADWGYLSAPPDDCDQHGRLAGEVAAALVKK